MYLWNEKYLWNVEEGNYLWNEEDEKYLWRRYTYEGVGALLEEEAYS